MLSLRILKTKKTINKESQGLGKVKEHVETILTREKNFRFLLMSKVKIRCWSNFSEINIRHYMSLKIPFAHRCFFEKELIIMST